MVNKVTDLYWPTSTSEILQNYGWAVWAQALITVNLRLYPDNNKKSDINLFKSA